MENYTKEDVIKALCRYRNKVLTMSTITKNLRPTQRIHLEQLIKMFDITIDKF